MRHLYSSPPWRRWLTLLPHVPPTPPPTQLGCLAACYWQHPDSLTAWYCPAFTGRRALAAWYWPLTTGRRVLTSRLLLAAHYRPQATRRIVLTAYTWPPITGHTNRRLHLAAYGGPPTSCFSFPKERTQREGRRRDAPMFVLAASEFVRQWPCATERLAAGSAHTTPMLDLSFLMPCAHLSSDNAWSGSKNAESLVVPP